MTHGDGGGQDRRMSVLHLVSSDQRRGAEVFASQLAGGLRLRGHAAAVCALHRAPEGAEGLGSDAGGYGPLGGRSVAERLVRFSPPVVWRLRGVLGEHRPDVIVAHGSSALRYGALCRLMWRRARTVYINIGTASFWANTAGRVRFNRLLLKGMDAVVSVSEHTRRDFMELYSYPGDRVAFIPNAVESPDFDIPDREAVRADVRRGLGIGPSETVIVSVGSLSVRKGQDELIRLLGMLGERGAGARLLLVGDGPLRGALERQASEAGLSGRVVFAGLRRDVPRVLCAGDVFALASESEGMPGVLIEAGLAGLAGFAYGVGGVGEVISDGETGLIAEPGDREGAAGALARLCTDAGLRGRMGAAARSRCELMFDMEGVVGQYERLFAELVRRGASVRGGRPLAEVVDGRG